MSSVFYNTFAEVNKFNVTDRNLLFKLDVKAAVIQIKHDTAAFINSEAYL